MHLGDWVRTHRLDSGDLIGDNFKGIYDRTKCLHCFNGFA